MGVKRKEGYEGKKELMKIEVGRKEGRREVVKE